MMKKWMCTTLVSILIMVNAVANAATYVPGKYMGTAKGFSDVIVKVKVDEESIIEAEIIGDGETPGFGDMAIEKLSEALIGARDANIDIIAGATLTSCGVQEALSIALTKAEQGISEDDSVQNAVTNAATYVPGEYMGTAKGFSDVIVKVKVDEESIIEAEIIGDGEHPDLGGMAIKKLSEALIGARDANIDIIAGATLTSRAVQEALNIALTEAEQGILEDDSVQNAVTNAATYVPGEYMGTAKGYNCDVIVKVKVDEESIIEAEIIGDGETPGFGDRAIEKLSEALIGARDANIDIIAGATLTSRGVQEALSIALTKAEQGILEDDSVQMHETEASVGSMMDRVIGFLRGNDGNIKESAEKEKSIKDRKQETQDLETNRMWENRKSSDVYDCSSCDGSGMCPSCVLGSCNSCLGSGQVLCSCLGGICSACGGQGYRSVYTSNGFDYRNCTVCGGTGNHTLCDGTGFRRCNACNGTGECLRCRGTGECNVCGGTGKR